MLQPLGICNFVRKNYLFLSLCNKPQIIFNACFKSINIIIQPSIPLHFHSPCKSHKLIRFIYYIKINSPPIGIMFQYKLGNRFFTPTINSKNYIFIRRYYNLITWFGNNLAIINLSRLQPLVPDFYHYLRSLFP